MHVRFRCIGNELEPYTGYLGQSRKHEPDALGLTEATLKVVANMCTTRAHPPTGAVAKPVFDPKLFNHCRHILGPVAVDSAENEIVSVNDMSRPHNDREAYFPNSFGLRDGAHSSRRLLSRLFKASPKIDFVFNFFTMLATIIQWSDELRKLYSECTSESTDAAVSTEFTHLRAAKHRIESMFSPLSRSCLDPTGEHMDHKKISV